MHTSTDNSSSACSSLCRKQDSTESPSCSTSNEKGPFEPPLPPIDGGYQAWMFLAASTMIEALVWGFAFSFGVFENYYRDNEEIKGSNMVAVIGTCATVSYFDPPVHLGNFVVEIL